MQGSYSFVKMSGKNNLYHHAHEFPQKLQGKYHKLLDALSGVYSGPDISIYELVRDIAELMLCPSKEDIVMRELKRRFLTLSDIGAVLFNERNIKTSMQQFMSKQGINIFQLRNCLFDWNRTFKRIFNISSDELNYIDDFLAKPSVTNKFNPPYFMENDIS